MIAALNDWGRAHGRPTVPTLTGRRPASRRLRRMWRGEHNARYYFARMLLDPPQTMATYSRMMEGAEDIS